MRSRNVNYTLIAILLLIGFAFYKSRFVEPQRREAFHRNPTRLQYAAFALCRMQCEGVDKDAIKQVMQHGAIHFNKSDRRYKPCPLYAVQARTRNGMYLRVIFEQCKTTTTVVNCYNLEAETACNCPDGPVKKVS